MSYQQFEFWLSVQVWQKIPEVEASSEFHQYAAEKFNQKYNNLRVKKSDKVIYDCSDHTGSSAHLMS